MAYATCWPEYDDEDKPERKKGEPFPANGLQPKGTNNRLTQYFAERERDRRIWPSNN